VELDFKASGSKLLSDFAADSKNSKLWFDNCALRGDLDITDETTSTSKKKAARKDRLLFHWEDLCGKQ
jgi:hypothetical protein